MPQTFTMVYGTNIWTHHQVPIAKAIAEIMGPENFRMALFEVVHEERRKLGWEDNSISTWVIGPPRSEEEKNRIIQQCIDADVMVVGACPMEVLKARTIAGKLSLVASERLLKKRFHHIRMFNPRYANGIIKYRKLANNSCNHALSIGHYAPNDLRILGLFGDRIWKWGYFVDINSQPPMPIQDQPLKLLWVGRMLDWKRVSDLLWTISRIQHLPNFGECVIVGDGPEKSRLMHLAKRLRLNSDRVRFHQPVHFEEVRKMMRNSDIYVFTSNRKEGWGAVAGEAMSEGCILVANEQAGSSQELIIDGETGFLFKDGNINQLTELLKRLSNDYPLRMHVRQRAWERMHKLWHPRVAAEHLIALCNGLLGIKDMPNFTDGPCCKDKNENYMA
ncbi:MAG: glycosyltransferase family 4 protein [Desulfamplus sp.]